MEDGEDSWEKYWWTIFFCFNVSCTDCKRPGYACYLVICSLRNRVKTTRLTHSEVGRKFDIFLRSLNEVLRYEYYTYGISVYLNQPHADLRTTKSAVKSLVGMPEYSEIPFKIELPRFWSPTLCSLCQCRRRALPQWSSVLIDPRRKGICHS